MSNPFPPPPPSAPLNINVLPFPRLDSPLTDASGHISELWRQFLNTIWNRINGAAGGNIAAITVGASPYSYTAASGGVLSIQGGTVSQVTIKRGSTTVTISTGLVPMRTNDVVAITYSAVPTVNFIPT